MEAWDAIRARRNVRQYKPEPVSEAESRDEATGGLMSWKRTRTATDMTRGVRLFFLERANERPLSAPTAAAPITAMDHVVIGTADPERTAALYGARLGLDMALDRSHPEWGRLMFFRCGDVVVEVAHKPGKEDATAPDRPRHPRHRHRIRHGAQNHRAARHPGR